MSFRIPNDPSPHRSSTPPNEPYALRGDDLITERLTLRPWPAAEITAVSAGARHPHWAADFPADGDRVIAGFLTAHPDARGTYGHRLIAERTSGLVVGSIGLFPHGGGRLEIGYGVVPSRRCRGYATEATRALAGFGLTAPGVHTVFAEVDPANPASVRVLRKAGLRYCGDGDTGTARFRITTAPAPQD
ncbi:GNAT family N-acetyltransferase [Streptomyces sp. NPDC050161]|uniref:GNAT family N-acetyltransferase n=1 Tax=Streptomyces sp. NPDC050161 TaxID=3365604 RepID=UPI0037880EAC